MRSLRESRTALLTSGLVVLVQFTLFLVIGAGLDVYYGQHAAETPGAPDRIFPNFIVQHIPRGLAGFMVAAILAAAMSNLSAALNSLSSTSVVDFYLRFRLNSEYSERTRVSRLLTFLWAAVLFVLAILSRGGGHIVEVGLSIAYGALLGVFLLGTLTRRANETGAIFGMVAGLIVNVLLWRQQGAILFYGILLPKVAWAFVAVGALLTLAVGYVARLGFGSRLEERR